MNTDKIELLERRELVHEDLTGQIIGAAIEVHNTLGSGFLEKVYENALVAELRLRGVKVEPQKSLKVFYKSTLVGEYQVDILVDDSIIVELKAVDRLTDIHQAQVLNYLRATNLKVGLLLNFYGPRLAWKRLVL